MFRPTMRLGPAATTAALVAALFIGGVFSAAQAEENSTAAAPSIAAEPSPGAQVAADAPLDLTHINVAQTKDDVDQKKHLAPDNARESLITIDASIEDQFPLGSDQRLKPGSLTDQIVFAGTARLRLFPGINLFFRRINHDNVAGATNGTSIGSFGYDIEGDYGIEYAANRNLRFEEFWKYRYRTCCPNAGDSTAFSATAKTPAGPRAERGFMTNVAYRFGPNTRIGRSFLITEEAQLYEHHLDYTIINNPAFIKAGNTLAGLPNASDTVLLWETHFYYYISVFGQKKVVPYIGYENKPSYFDSNTQPSVMHRIRYGVTVRLNPTFALEGFVKSDHTYPAQFNGSHNTTLFTDLLVHLKS